MSVPLSVVILAKNEAGRLAECLRSVEWAAERLVVDDNSTDETVRIAESLGARVVRRAMDIEGRHRNWAHAQAAHEWVLSVDADERVTPELAQEITQMFQQGAPPFQVYEVPRRNYIGQRWIRYGGWYPSPQVKLFKKSVFSWEEAAVHPRAFANCPSGRLQHDLIHYSYRDVADFVDKLNRQTTLEARKWAEAHRPFSLGKALWRTGDRFFRTWVLKQGYRDGMIGFFVAWSAGSYQLVSYFKYCEARRRFE